MLGLCVIIAVLSFIAGFVSGMIYALNCVEKALEKEPGEEL